MADLDLDALERNCIGDAITLRTDDMRALLARLRSAEADAKGWQLGAETHLERIVELERERDEAREMRIRAEEDHRAAVESLETYEDRIKDIADHVLGIQPPNVATIVLLDVIERRCGEEHIAARQAEAVARDQLALIESGRAALAAEHATALECLRQAEAAEDSVRELVAEVHGVEDGVVDGATEVAAILRLRALRAVAEAARAFQSALGFVYWVTACDDAGASYDLVEKACQASRLLEEKLAALDAAKEGT